MTRSEAIKRINEYRNTPDFQPYGYINEALDMAIKALEKQEKIEEAFQKWKNDTSGIYGADDETTQFISTLKQILRSDNEQL